MLDISSCFLDNFLDKPELHMLPEEGEGDGDGDTDKLFLETGGQVRHQVCPFPQLVSYQNLVFL